MSKTLKRPMFKMGGKPDMNSGIVSGFEREKFSSGTGEGGDSTRRAIDIMYPDAKSSMDFQPQADLITAAKQSAAATAPTCLLYTSPSPRDGLLSRMPSSA